MLNKENKHRCSKVIDIYPREHQLMILMEELAELFVDDCDNNGDKKLEYAKAKRDEAILKIVGPENFVPFDYSYGMAYMDELKRIRILKEGGEPDGKT